MLSIGKMVARSEEYYIRTVAKGREEYYTGSGESPGYWVGEDFRAALASDGTAAIMADVANYTTIAPITQLSETF